MAGLFSARNAFHSTLKVMNAFYEPRKDTEITENLLSGITLRSETIEVFIAQPILIKTSLYDLSFS